MNRIIKFRGKRVNGGEWVESMTISNGTIKRKAYKMFFEISPNKWVGVIPETVGQFTGLLDKNGKEIYEGDVLESRYDDSVSILGYCLVRNKVSYDQGTFGVIGEVTGDLMPFFDYPLQDEYVIGNIHDNPELLKGG